MKIDIIGNHCTWTKQLNTSFLINDEIVFDIPLGSFKKLYNDYDISKVNYIIISHFHSDHFCDIFLLLEVLGKSNKNVTILAPKGCKQRIEMLMRTFDVPAHISYLDNFKFIDAENNKIVKIGNYKIKCFFVTHGNLDAYGFVVDDGKVKVGFSGDSCMCNNIRKIAKTSNVMFIDSANITSDTKHLATFEVKSLSDEFVNTTFYPVHLSNKSEKTLDQFGLNHILEGQTIII